MIESFYSKKGEYYQVNLEDERVYKDNTLLPSSEVEIVYLSDGEFAGVHFLGTHNIITKSGNVVPITDSDEIN